MRIVTWTAWLLLFILLLAFAAKNTEPVALRFYFDLTWQAPLVLLLFAFFAAGALLGLIAALGTLLRRRRELLRLRCEARGVSQAPQSHPAPQLPPSAAEG
jgi:uncharacterized integral membrane protein